MMCLRSSLSVFWLILLLCWLPGCDFVGDDAFDVPTERLVAMTAVYDEVNDNGSAVQRLVLADFENPANYQVLSQAGTFASEPRFSPDKRKLLFVDRSGASTFSGGQITLLDLESGAERPLFFDTEDGGQAALQGSLKGLVWEPDGTGFYSAQSGVAGLLVAYHYDLSEQSFRVFAQTEGGATVIPYGRKGQDSILVLSNEMQAPDGAGFYFVDGDTGQYLERIKNKKLGFRALEPAYNNTLNLIAFQDIDSTGATVLAVTNLDGSFFEEYGATESKVYTSPQWSPGSTVLMDCRPRTTTDYKTYRVMIANIETGEVRTFVEPETINGAVGLRTPDY